MALREFNQLYREFPHGRKQANDRMRGTSALVQPAVDRFLYQPGAEKQARGVISILTQSAIDMAIQARFRKPLEKISFPEREIVQSTMNDLMAFVSAYIGYLYRPAGQRGVLAENNGKAPGGFEEKFVACGKGGFGDWKLFSKRENGSSRLVVGVNPRTNELAILGAYTNHEEYADMVANFCPSKIKARVAIRINGHVFPEIVHGPN